MQSWADLAGFRLPDQADFLTVGSAALIVGAALLVGWAIAKFGCPSLTSRMRFFEPNTSDDLAIAICTVVRNSSAWLILAIAIRAYAWPPLALIILGSAAAASAALAAMAILRAAQMSRVATIWLVGFVFVIVLANALGGLTALTELLDSVGLPLGARRLSLLGALKLLVIVAGLYVAVRLGNRLVKLAARRSGVNVGQQLLLRKLASIAFLVLAFFIGIGLAGLDLTAFTVFSGAFALAVGFGLQKSLGNLFSGIILLMDRSVKPGDVIAVADTFGEVRRMGVRATSIVTRDGKEHLIPNEDLMTNPVENWSYSTRNVRIRIPVRIARDSDVSHAQELMVQAALSATRVLANPRPKVLMRKLDEQGIHHEIRAWVSDPEAGIWGVESDILNRLWVLFRENGIVIPYQQRELRVKSVPPPEQVP